MPGYRLHLILTAMVDTHLEEHRIPCQVVRSLGLLEHGGLKRALAAVKPVPAIVGNVLAERRVSLFHLSHLDGRVEPAASARA